MRERESVATCTAGIRARKASRSNISPLENKVQARIPPGHDLRIEFKTVRQLGIPVEMRFLDPLPVVHWDGAQVCGRMTPSAALGSCVDGGTSLRAVWLRASCG